MPNNSPQIGVDVSDGDRGVPALCRDSTTGKYRPLTVDASGNLTMASSDTTFSQISSADDNVTTINYSDATKSVVSSVVQTSASVGHTSTETFNGAGATTLVITRVIT
jgi:hypothetical protein